MKKTYKHTSGPWEVVPNKDRSSLFIYRKGAPDGAVPLARTLADERENVDQEANAYLIAAAPSMLYEIENLVGAYQNYLRERIPAEHREQLSIFMGRLQSVIIEANGLVECQECGVTKLAREFYDPSVPEPQCKECNEGEWSERGEDPHGRDWG